MNGLKGLKKVFDRQIISVINALSSDSSKNFSLNQIAYISGVKTSNCLKIINKLIEKNYIETNQIGYTKSYRWKQTPQTDFLMKLLKSN